MISCCPIGCISVWLSAGSVAIIVLALVVALQLHRRRRKIEFGKVGHKLGCRSLQLGSAEVKASDGSGKWIIAKG